MPAVSSSSNASQLAVRSAESASGDASQLTGSSDGTSQVTTDGGVVTPLHTTVDDHGQEIQPQPVATLDTDRTQTAASAAEIFIEGATFFTELTELPELEPGLMWKPDLEGPDGHYKVVRLKLGDVFVGFECEIPLLPRHLEWDAGPFQGSYVVIHASSKRVSFTDDRQSARNDEDASQPSGASQLASSGDGDSQPVK